MAKLLPGYYCLPGLFHVEAEWQALSVPQAPGLESHMVLQVISITQTLHLWQRQPWTSKSRVSSAFGGAFCDGVGFFTVNISLSSNTKNRESSKCEGQPQIRSEICILLSTILVLSFSSRVVLCKSFLCLGSGAVDPRLCAVTLFNLFGSTSCSFANTRNSVVFGDIIMRQVKGLFFIRR